MLLTITLPIVILEINYFEPSTTYADETMK